MPRAQPEPAPEPARIELRWLLLGLANAFAPGLALWAWTRGDRKAVLLDNILEPGTTPWAALAWGAASAILVGGLYLWVGARAADRKPALRRLTLLLAPLAVTIAIPLLYVPEIERARRLLVVTLTLLCSGAVGVSVATAWPWLRQRDLLARLGASVHAPPITLGALVLGYCAMMIRLGVIRHRALESRIWDLGIFDNLLYHAAQGHWQTTTVLRGETFTSAHCAPILQLLAPIYAIAPGPETLITTQVVWLASGAIPVYLLAADAFSEWPARRWLGVVFGLSWLCHPSLHGVSLFDFHALTLAAPMIVWAVYALETQRVGLWIAMITALLLTREDLPFVVIALGIYALAAGRRRQAALTILAALATLAFVKLVLMQDPGIFMPNAESSYRYANRFSKVIPDPETGGATDILATVVSNPGFVIQHALTPAKLIYMATLALPTLALFVLGGRALWALSFGLAFTALGSGSNLHNLYLHYTVFSFPAMAAAAVFGLRNLVERLEPPHRTTILVGFAAALTCAGLLAGDRLGALGHSEAFVAGHAPLIRELEDHQRERYAWLADAVQKIPADASVTATDSLGPHVSTRAQLYHFRDQPTADYLVLHEAELSPAEQRSLTKRVRLAELEQVARYAKEMVIYRRRSDP
ncbi:DUF2079 domain-containing protein [Enhygromyxa salina]|uniref:DUF2079 domain-containing protein n=1 Tax=Enhygromyxa salina TaxID=215803 RepID=A0A2S9YKC2_9BACT|nr:DUF2079 domain-containing protein [Enhygromyxa salina]PRQ05476.1 hypothetical protein ENSA7_45940 [Enhygromyxa salina]